MRQNRRKQPGGGLFVHLFCAILFYEKVLPDLRLNQLVQSQATLRSLTSRVYRFELRFTLGALSPAPFFASRRL